MGSWYKSDAPLLQISTKHELNPETLTKEKGVVEKQ